MCTYTTAAESSNPAKYALPRRTTHVIQKHICFRAIEPRSELLWHSQLSTYATALSCTLVPRHCCAHSRSLHRVPASRISLSALCEPVQRCPYRSVTLRGHLDQHIAPPWVAAEHRFHRGTCMRLTASQCISCQDCEVYNSMACIIMIEHGSADMSMPAPAPPPLTQLTQSGKRNRLLQRWGDPLIPYVASGKPPASPCIRLLLPLSIIYPLETVTQH